MQNIQTAKLFANGSSQAVRLPKNFRFKGDEVGVKRVGEIVILFPTDSDWANFCNCPPVDEDFGESILQARHEHFQAERAQL
jgi:virulence-associated protein VagC